MYIEISTQQLSGDISKMENHVGQLEAIKRQVFSCLEGLNSMWIGPTHDSFEAQVRVDHEVLEGLLQSLHNLIECMQYAKSEYENCQGRVSENITAIQLSGDH